MKIKEKSMIFVIIIIFVLAIILFLYNRKLKNEIGKLEISNNELSNLVSEQEEKIKNENEPNVEATLNDGNGEEIKIDNVKPISKERAKEIVEDYIKNVLYEDVDNKFEFVEIREENIKYKKDYIITENKYVIKDTNNNDDGSRYLDIRETQKKAYAVYYATELELEKMTGYVDIDTGEFLGMYRAGI